jgi:urea transport system permease protein
VAVGGRGTLFGAATGAVLVNYAKTYFTGALPEVWLYALGILFVLVTLFLPRGLVGLGGGRRRSLQAGSAALAVWALRSHIGASLESKLK